MNDLIIPSRETAMQVFSQSNGLQPYLAKIRDEIDAFVPDVSSKKGRDQIASIAHKVARSKTALDNLGKELVAELKELPKKIDAERKAMRDTLDGWKDEVRKPLTEWEQAEEARVQGHRSKLAVMYQMTQVTSETASDEIAASLAYLKGIEIGDHCEEFLEEYARTKDGAIAALDKALPVAVKREQDAAELERLRAEQIAREQADREAAMIREAEERARREAAAQAEAAAKAEREAAERRELELKHAAEKAEREKLEAQQAAAAERQRIADEQAKAESDRLKRESDMAHRSAVMRAAKEDIMAAGVTEEQAKKIVLAIVAGTVRNIRINF